MLHSTQAMLLHMTAMQHAHMRAILRLPLLQCNLPVNKAQVLNSSLHTAVAACAAVEACLLGTGVLDS